MLVGMEELPLAEMLERLTGAARREEAPFVGPDRGEAIYRACLAAQQILEARPDGHKALSKREPPAPGNLDAAQSPVARSTQSLTPPGCQL